jgi:glucose-6-phosphate isomerase
MGGSILGIKSIYSFLKQKIKKNIFFFDNLDENLHIDFSKIKNLKNTCFVIISKSGNTLETIANLNIIPKKLITKRNLIFICEFKNNALLNYAKKLNATVIEHKPYIGGRYSVFSEAGMLPSILMNLNYKRFKNCLPILNNHNFKSNLIKNVANILTLINSKKRTSIIINYNSNLNDLGYWYQQLTAESLGKKRKGITPIISFAPKDNHSLLQLYLDGPRDKFFTFINSSCTKGYKTYFSNKNKLNYIQNTKLENLVKAQHDATKKIFKKQNIPFRCFYFKKRNEEDIGLLFYFFILETILLAKLMKINPFDQPAVEQVKVATKKILLN